MWDHLKRRLRETRVPAMRTKAACLRVCAGGPWLIVYPDGVWYGGVTLADVDEIIEQHLVGGRPVERLIIPPEELTGKPIESWRERT